MGQHRSIITPGGPEEASDQAKERKQKQAEWNLLRKINTLRINNPGADQEAARRYDIGVFNDVLAGENSGNRIHIPPGLNAVVNIEIP